MSNIEGFTAGRDGDLWFLTREVIGNLTNHGNMVVSTEIIDVLWEISEINDDLAHGRDYSIIKEKIERAKIFLDRIK